MRVTYKQYFNRIYFSDVFALETRVKQTNRQTDEQDT